MAACASPQRLQLAMARRLDSMAPSLGIPTVLPRSVHRRRDADLRARDRPERRPPRGQSESASPVISRQHLAPPSASPGACRSDLGASWRISAGHGDIDHGSSASSRRAHSRAGFRRALVEAPRGSSSSNSRGSTTSAAERSAGVAT